VLTCSRGASRSRRISFAARGSESPRSRHASATARRAPSVPRSAGTLGSLRAGMRASS